MSLFFFTNNSITCSVNMLSETNHTAIVNDLCSVPYINHMSIPLLYLAYTNVQNNIHHAASEDMYILR